jgi:putative ABC transport system permease protein
MRFRFFLRLLRRSLANRLGKWLTAILAVAMGAALVSASLSLAAGMGAKMRQALRAYGANIVLVPAAGARQAAGEQLFAQLPEDVLVKLAKVTQNLPVLGYAPLLYAVTEIGSHRVALVGTWPDAVRQINPWWRVEGGWLGTRTVRDEAVIGTALAQKLALGVGGQVTLTVDRQTRSFRIAGILSTGGSEDEQVVVTLPAAQELAGRRGQLSLVQVSASSAADSVEAISKALEAALPGVAARTQVRLLMAEARVVTRVAWLLAVIAGLVLVASSLGVAAAVTTGVLQRTGEIGLMKALGASGLRVASLFLSEAAAVGLAGGILGGVAGMMLARVIARTAFGDSLPFAVIPMVISVAIGIGAASVASLVPVLRAAAIEPATVLRGE